ncbi:hypothetical protein [Dermabacter hominis]|uniref:hypothetical protein n=1 Tax=Dermabacter hominis TaxID=36740 RepID=UPI0021A5018D|nr:hypothetical protein [Dermabacter hominis]MCT1790626.1 hypothetical protein [Dermabacter hominis]
MATKPQDYRRKQAKAKKQKMHDPSELFSFTSEFTKITIEIPYFENIVGGIVEDAFEQVGDLGEGAVMLAVLKGVIGEDEYAETFKQMLQREQAAMLKRWSDESVVNLGESSAS